MKECRAQNVIGNFTQLIQDFQQLSSAHPLLGFSYQVGIF